MVSIANVITILEWEWGVWDTFISMTLIVAKSWYIAAYGINWQLYDSLLGIYPRCSNPTLHEAHTTVLEGGKRGRGIISAFSTWFDTGPGWNVTVYAGELQVVGLLIRIMGRALRNRYESAIIVGSMPVEPGDISGFESRVEGPFQVSTSNTHRHVHLSPDSSSRKFQGVLLSYRKWRILARQGPCLRRIQTEVQRWSYSTITRCALLLIHKNCQAQRVSPSPQTLLCLHILHLADLNVDTRRPDKAALIKRKDTHGNRSWYDREGRGGSKEWIRDSQRRVGTGKIANRTDFLVLVRQRKVNCDPAQAQQARSNWLREILMIEVVTSVKGNDTRGDEEEW
ncbi:hypothetical protein BJV78DRAFT_1355646 [Lactifluus subvellereus]|nr:hypothetical protein BJV78DRAFT_1355646 [Lactifluus subvellereus]